MIQKDTLKSRLSELCKDMGLSSKALDSLCDIALTRLSDDATEDGITSVLNEIVPFAKVIQSEGTRISADVRKKLDSKPTEPVPVADTKPQAPQDVSPTQPPKSFDVDYLKQLSDQIAQLTSHIKEQDALYASERRSHQIAQVAKKIGLPEQLASQIVIPEDADVEKTLTAFKQEMVTNVLPTLGGDGSGSKSSVPSDESLKQTVETVMGDMLPHPETPTNK